MKIKTLILLLSLAIALILSALTYTIFERLKENNTFLQGLAQRASFYQKINDDSRLAQVSFQRQVQEWKNILIRGNEQDLYDKHLQGFTDREVQSLKIFNDISNKLNDSKLNDSRLKKVKADIENLIKEQKTLGEKYRESLNSYKKEDLNSVRTVDVLVKGMDRPASAAMDETAKSIQELTELELKQIILSIDEEYKEIQTYLITAIGIALSFIFISCFIIGFRILSVLGAEPVKLNAFFAQLALGNFKESIVVKKGDSTSVAANTKLMHMKLKNMILSIKNISDEVVESASGVKIDSERDEIQEALRKTKKVTNGLKQTVDRFNA